MTSVSPGDAGAAPGHAGQPGAQGFASSSAEFFLQNYRLGKTLGIGSFGKVKVAEHILTGHKVAIKILNRKKIKQMDMEEKVRREIKILRLFMHPHIIRLYEVVETTNDIYVVMEYVKAGELFDYIVEKGRLLEDEARHFFQQIISGVEYCHRNMVVHRDLKPENLLLDSKMNVKIADFGLSNVMRDGHFLKTSCGSPNYAAPEVISGRLYAGPEVDVWSCGVILYALLCGSLPFDDENIPNLFKKIKGGIYTLPSHLSPGARDLIPRMLLVDPLKRITIPEIRQHPWFTVHLPRYLAVMQADPVAAGTHIDEDIIRDVVRLGFTRDFVVDSLRARQQNKASVAYYLMADNRRRMPSSAYLKEEMTEATDPGLAAFPSGVMATSRSNTSLQPAPRLVVERRWRLGLCSRAHPSSIMQELYRTLQYCGVFWKKNGPYNLKCRAVLHLTPPADGGSGEGGGGAAPNGQAGASGQLTRDHSDDSMGVAMEASPAAAGQQQQGALAAALAAEDARMAEAAAAVVGSGGSDSAGSLEREVKFEAQLYKMRDGEYALDFQRLSGDLFLFMDTCSSLLSVLRL
jgi:5'-AMP-activated protein kinase catalytic alpha subunit